MLILKQSIWKHNSHKRSCKTCVYEIIKPRIIFKYYACYAIVCNYGTYARTYSEYKVVTYSHTPITPPSPFNLCPIYLTISFPMQNLGPLIWK